MIQDGAPGAGGPAALGLARAAFAGRRYDEAARLAGAAIASGSTGAGLHGLLAAALLAERRPGPALAACERARALAPGAAWPWRLQALALADLRRGREAVASAESAVHLAPSDPWAQDALARCCAAAGRAEEARAAAREALRLAPRDPDLVRRAGAALGSQDPGAAEARCREAIGLDPSSAVSWDALAAALRRQGRDADAAAARARAAALDPAFAERYRRRRTFFSLFQAGAALFLAIVALGMLPRILRPPAAGVATAVLWLVALLAPALFAVGAAVALQRGPRYPPPPDPQLADVVRGL